MMTMTEKQTLINEISLFCTTYSVPPSTFGRLALNNPNFVSDLQKETYDPHLSTVTKLRVWMKNQAKKRQKLLNREKTDEES